MKNDRSQGCIINGEQAYMFVRNMQGDVIALADEKGNALVEYNYDPWGKITCTYLGEGEGEDQATLQMATAILCPLTYRGYNYDFSTGLYYLQSRYYNPEWGRFLNCDDTSILLATQGETHGANMFAYCGNNPVNDIDPSGMRSLRKKDQSFPEWVGNLLIILAVLGLYVDDEGKDNIYFWSSKVKGKPLYVIHINMVSLPFFTMIKNCVEVNSELTYEILTLISRANVEAKEKANRYFLFSDECIADEIKFHINSYWSADNYRDGVNQGVLQPDGISNLLYTFLAKHGGKIDISEADVYNSQQAKLFNYNGGIRSCYKSTSADPYRLPNLTRSSSSKVPQDRTEWERWLTRYGRLNSV